MDIQWELLIFSMLIGLSMGIFLFLCYSEIRGGFTQITWSATLFSLITLVIGGLASFFHLGHPERIFHILGNIESGIAQELIVTAFCGVAVLGYMFFLKKGESGTGGRKVCAYIGIVFALIAPISTGKIYLLAARPAWNTITLPILYLASSIAMGTLFLYWLSSQKEDLMVIKRVRKWSLVGVTAFAAMIAAYLLAVSIAPYPHESRDISRVISGDLALLFWGGVVLLGIVLPLIMTGRAYCCEKREEKIEEKELRNFDRNAAMVSLLGVVSGSASIRVIMYLIGSSIEQFFK